MYNLHKSKRYDLKELSNDTSLYLDDVFTIDNLTFEKYIPKEKRKCELEYSW